MTDKPIIFSAPMVRALMAGRKTQTRRVLKPKWRAGANEGFTGWKVERVGVTHWQLVGGMDVGANIATPYAVGDRLYVREAHYMTDDGTSGYAVYAENQQDVANHLLEMDDLKGQFPQVDWSRHLRLRPSIHEVRAKVLKTAFRKGNRPHTYKGAGHERIDNKDGYVVMIVDEVNPWTGAATRPVFKHRWLWEQEHGPVPEGMALKCLDGDKTNCAPSNWKLIPRGMLPRLNNRWGRNYDTAEPDVKPALMAIARIEQRIDDIKGGDT